MHNKFKLSATKEQLEAPAGHHPNECYKPPTSLEEADRRLRHVHELYDNMILKYHTLICIYGDHEKLPTENFLVLSAVALERVTADLIKIHQILLGDV